MHYYLTVIIVTLNAAENLEETLVSLINFRHSRLKIIIIDGASSDSTISIIAKYTNSIFKWVSEPDEGVFHAMNKALLEVKGDTYVSWINAGDKILNLEGVFRIIDDHRPDLILCSVQEKFHVKNSTRILKPCTSGVKLTNINFYKNSVHHQGFIIKSSAIKVNYMLNFNDLADYVFMWTHINLKSKNYIINNDDIYSEFITGGISYKPNLKRLKSMINCMKFFHLSPILISIYSPYRFARMVLRQLLPYSVIIFYRNFLNF